MPPVNIVKSRLPYLAGGTTPPVTPPGAKVFISESRLPVHPDQGNAYRFIPSLPDTRPATPQPLMAARVPDFWPDAGWSTYLRAITGAPPPQAIVPTVVPREPRLNPPDGTVGYQHAPGVYDTSLRLLPWTIQGKTSEEFTSRLSGQVLYGKGPGSYDTALPPRPFIVSGPPALPDPGAILSLIGGRGAYPLVQPPLPVVARTIEALPFPGFVLLLQGATYPTIPVPIRALLGRADFLDLPGWAGVEIGQDLRAPPPPKSLIVALDPLPPTGSATLLVGRVLDSTAPRRPALQVGGVDDLTNLGRATYLMGQRPTDPFISPRVLVVAPTMQADPGSVWVASARPGLFVPVPAALLVRAELLPSLAGGVYLAGGGLQDTFVPARARVVTTVETFFDPGLSWYTRMLVPGTVAGAPFYFLRAVLYCPGASAGQITTE